MRFVLIKYWNKYIIYFYIVQFDIKSFLTNISNKNCSSEYNYNNIDINNNNYNNNKNNNNFTSISQPGSCE